MATGDDIIRYRADWTSQDAIEYRIDIIDTQYLGQPYNLEIGMDAMDGFTLDYQGGNSGRFNPILPSECIVNCVVCDTCFETFISDIINAQEQRFFIKIYKRTAGTYYLFWAGLVLQDLINTEDIALPYAFQLKATDGLGRLKSIDFPYTLNTAQTFLEYLIDILALTGLTTLFATNDAFLRTAVNYYEKSQFTTSPATTLDPLVVSRINNNTFLEIDDEGLVTPMNCFDVLTQIAYRWHATLIQEAGIFNFIQIGNQARSTFESRTYKKSGVNLSNNAAENLRISSIIRQGTWSFLPALGAVNLKHNHKQSVYYSNLLPDQSAYEIATSIGTIQGGNNEKLVFTGTINCVMIHPDVDEAGEYHKWEFWLYLKIGNYYLSNEDGGPEWSTDTNARYIIYSPFYTINTGFSRYFDFSITTPEIPLSSTGEFALDFNQFVDDNGDEIIADIDVSWENTCLNFSLVEQGATEFYKGTELFRATQETATTAKIELPDILTGDGPGLYPDGRVQVYTTGATWINSNEEWIIQGLTAASANINNLLLSETLAGQLTPVHVYTGSMRGNGIVISPLNILEFASKSFCFRGGSFNANDNIWTGDWVQLLSPSGISSVTAARVTDSLMQVEAGVFPQGDYEPAFAKSTAFNKNFSVDAADIKADGEQSLGELLTLARADHVHPLSELLTLLEIFTWEENETGSLHFNGIFACPEFQIYPEGGPGVSVEEAINAKVEISGTPVDNDFARFTDANTIEGRSAAEVLSDLGIEAGATADQTAAEIKTSYESNANTNAFTDADHSKLNGIEASADVNPTASEIKTAYESNTNTNAFTDADHSKLNGIEAGATADQTAAEIKTSYESNANTNAFTDADHSKLNGIEAGADVSPAIDNTPVNGQTAESISSNWAYDHAANSEAHPRDERNQVATANLVTGSGTIGTIPKFSAAGVLANSNIKQVGSQIEIDDGLTVGSGITASSLSTSATIHAGTNITAAGEVTAYSSSDKRLKKNIKPIENATEILAQLKPVTFHWNDKAKALNRAKDDRLNYGLIAQEVEESNPEIVHPIYRKYKSLDYEQLISILIKSNQELNERVSVLEKIINDGR